MSNPAEISVNLTGVYYQSGGDEELIFASDSDLVLVSLDHGWSYFQAASTYRSNDAMRVHLPEAGILAAELHRKHNGRSYEARGFKTSHLLSGDRSFVQAGAGALNVTYTALPEFVPIAAALAPPHSESADYILGVMQLKDSKWSAFRLSGDPHTPGVTTGVELVVPDGADEDFYTCLFPEGTYGSEGPNYRRDSTIAPYIDGRQFLVRVQPATENSGMSVRLIPSGR